MYFFLITLIGRFFMSILAEDRISIYKAAMQTTITTHSIFLQTGEEQELREHPLKAQF